MSKKTAQANSLNDVTEDQVTIEAFTRLVDENEDVVAYDIRYTVIRPNSTHSGTYRAQVAELDADQDGIVSQDEVEGLILALFNPA